MKQLCYAKTIVTKDRPYYHLAQCNCKKVKTGDHILERRTNAKYFFLVVFNPLYITWVINGEDLLTLLID